MKEHRILIIDDEPWSREVVKALGHWDQHGIRIVGEAEDGLQGLQMMQELLPDIVLTDMRMPGMEGVALLEQMSSQHPSIQIIVMSGYDDFVYLKQAIRSRAVEYLLKPVNPEELNEALARTVKNLEAATRSIGSGNTPIVFADKNSLDQYLAYRQRIFSFLLMLDKQAVEAEFQKLGLFLEQSFANVNVSSASMAGQIGHDFLLMLGKFAGEHDLALEHVYDAISWDESEGRASWLSFQEAATELATSFGFVMDQFELQKTRGRLDPDEVKGYITNHYADEISLESVARHFHVSKTYLSRMFKQHTGENVSDLILRLRMEKARALIVEQAMPIKYAAQMAGYEDLTYFYRVFKKHFGVPPGGLRK
ncbi:hypothetical protein JCM10914A_37790 [Paenibacillus sp. JCM 10914]|uniref:response regulator transcription factor n=1 Tax=Paenibacillus sp. JCM 10914 TaxID=1236974 RepID=UPI0003CCA9AC|nr:response regulator [Paenibacillus sp. JCM 10914]GAE04476.1 two-component response regulator yesN [Paenibacillus sp. JCM 10914]